jgi:hypothetical protein
MPTALRQGERGRARSLLNISLTMRHHLPHNKSNLAVRRLAAPQQAEKPKGSCLSACVRRCAQAETFPSPWQRERAKRLHRIFTNVERRLAGGLTIRRAFKHPSWFNRQRFYRCDPSKRRLFCVDTLIQNFYRWRKNGRTAEALTLKYHAWNKGMKGCQRKGETTQI